MMLKIAVFLQQYAAYTVWHVYVIISIIYMFPE